MLSPTSRLLSTAVSKSKPFFVTTPIFYVNAKPHLGHVYTAVLADVQTRFRRLIDPENGSFLSTGTDEHGLKIQRAAASAKQTPLEFCDQVSASYRHAFAQCDIQHHDFMRTTEERHRECVQNLWRKLDQGGNLRKAKYESWYCVPDETFLTELQTEERVMPDGSKARVSLVSGHPVEWAEEENYVFPLSKFQADIKHWLDSKDIIHPKIFRSHLNSMLDKEELRDLSVSRSSARLSWGVPVPDDPGQVIYVWLDALANYLTAAQSQNNNIWPPDVQLVGKDILTFHAVFWPAFLMAADLELPKRILCHSHWMVNNEKMSKSKGNVLDPETMIERFSGDGFRYCLLKEGVPHSDGNFRPDQMVDLLNVELANTLGNLLNRCTAKTVNLSQAVPAFDQMLWDKHASDSAKELANLLEGLSDQVADCYSDFNYYQGIDLIMNVLRKTNGYVEGEKPWELKKTDPESLKVLLGLVLETLRVSGILLQPIVPSLANNLLNKLNVQNKNWSDAKIMSWQKSSDEEILLSDQKVILFKKVK